MRIGIISDIHCQHRALAMAIEAMGPLDRLLCLGDGIDQTRFCNHTIGMLREYDAQAILGNHEEIFFAGRGRYSPSVDPDLAEWLAGRPQSLEITSNGHRLLAVHSTPWESSHAYVPPNDPRFSRFAQDRYDIIVYGHTHQPVVRQIGPTLVVNPGSIGEGRPTPNGFIRSCAVVDLANLSARLIDID